MNFLGAFLLLMSLPPSLQAIRTEFQKVSSFRVDFVQTSTSELVKGPNAFKGELQFQKNPQVLTWNYREPRKREIKIEGEKVSVTEGGSTEVMDSMGSISLEQSFSFLWGTPDEKIFKIEKMNDAGFIVSPRKKDEASFEFMKVYVKSGRVVRVIVKDHLEGQTEIQFSNWKLK